MKGYITCYIGDIIVRFLLPSSGYQDCILESLSFPEQLVSTSSYEANKNVTCILCSKSTPLSEKNELLKHLVLEHKVVIADVRLIADFSRYPKCVLPWLISLF